MTLKFTVSAPGKVILHGEHSVVYGKPAIAGVVQVRNKLHLQETSTEQIKVNFEKLGLCFDLNNDAVTQLTTTLNQDNFPNLSSPHELNHEEFVKIISKFVEEQFPSRELSSRERDSITSFIYLLVGIKLAKKSPKTPSFSVYLDTEMSIGAGLGSSASFGVCLAAAFVMLVNVQQDQEFISKFNSASNEGHRNEVLKEISDWAFCSEKIMHGNPSGLDNTICTFGNVVKFYRGREPEPISLGCPLPILLVDTCVSRSTATLVQRVVALKQRHPELVQSVFDAMGHVVEDATQILKTITGGDLEQFKSLEELVAINNNLLRAIDVSHPKLEEIFTVAENRGFKAKLSGAGGGGFAIILLGPEDQWISRDLAGLKEDLGERGFQLIQTQLGGVGLEVVEGDS